MFGVNEKIRKNRSHFWFELDSAPCFLGERVATHRTGFNSNGRENLWLIKLGVKRVNKERGVRQIYVFCFFLPDYLTDIARKF